MITTNNIFLSDINSAYFLRVEIYDGCGSIPFNLENWSFETKVFDQLSNLVASQISAGTASGYFDIFIDKKLPATTLSFNISATSPAGKVNFIDFKVKRTAEKKLKFYIKELEPVSGLLNAPLIYKGIINNKKY